MAEVRRSFGLAVRIFRDRRGWSQAQLAQASSIDRGYISKIESGGVDPGLEMQRRLADAFSISLSELIVQAEEEERRLRSQVDRSSGQPG
jgi:transcriptional regulator with XRE-family HTH domain